MRQFGGLISGMSMNSSQRCSARFSSYSCLTVLDFLSLFSFLLSMAQVLVLASSECGHQKLHQRREGKEGRTSWRAMWLRKFD